MNLKFFQLRSLITYWLDAVDEHSLHSPFFFNLYTQVVRQRQFHEELERIEAMRSELLHNYGIIEVMDLGAGSLHFKTSARQISHIASISLTPKKYSLLYRNLIRHFNASRIIEFGTSLGINTLYLGFSNGTQIMTLEGSPQIADIAQDLFDRLDCTNISLIRGDIANTLPRVLETLVQVDLALIDANHRYAPTLHYFESLLPKVHERTVIVLDDIHHSPEMEAAWNHIRSHASVYASADLFRCGLVFFNPSLARQHFVLQF